MDEIINLVVQKTGISRDQAKTAVETVVNFLKQKLPAPLAGQIDSLLNSGGAQDMLKGLGNMLGK
jgi:ribosomal protein L31E